MRIKGLVTMSALLVAALASVSVQAATVSLLKLYDGNDGTYEDGSDWLSDILGTDLTETTRLNWVFDADGDPLNGNQLINPQTLGGFTITGTTFKAPDDPTEVIAGNWSYTSATNDIDYLTLKFDNFFALYLIEDYVLGETVVGYFDTLDYVSMDVLDWDENVVGVFGTDYKGGKTDFALSHGTTYVTTVPVPAAVWLFGSGLLGLVGVARRKKA